MVKWILKQIDAWLSRDDDRKKALILDALADGEKYGLEISNATGLGIGGLYPTLHRMEKEGMIESRWVDDYPPERGGARRRYYKIKQD